MLPQETLDLAARLLSTCRAKNLRVATAESCTGGLIAAALTHAAGASDVFDRGFVTYSNEAKTELLGIPADLIAKYGAVSEEVARAMAAGALRLSRANMAVAVTGIAGPGGGSAEKPVGLVWFGFATTSRCMSEKKIFPGNRAEIRAYTVAHALTLLESP